jgi:threonine/homoserine/homoserine lactone efflux protein
MSLGVYAAFCLSSVLIACLPGPAMMMVINHGLTEGYKNASKTISGIILADVILLWLIELGVGAIFVSSPVLYQTLQWLCFIYLCYLAIVSFREGVKSISRDSNLTFEGVYGFFNGLTTTLVNPKTLVFLIAYFPQFIDRQAQWSEWYQWLILAISFVVIVFFVMSLYALLAQASRRLFKNKVFLSLVQLMFGLVLMLTAAGIARELLA